MFSTFLFYLFAFVVVIFVYLLARLLIRLYFKSKAKRLESKTYPIIVAILVLSSAFSLRFGLDQLIILIMQKIEGKDFIASPPSSIFADIFFYFCITIIIVTYIRSAFREIEINLSDDAIGPVHEKIQIPTNDYEYPVELKDRVKRLIELYHEKEGLSLSFDKEYNFLFGKYRQGLHSYLNIYYCASEYEFIEVQESDLRSKLSEISQIIQKHNLRSEKEALSIYYVCARGKLIDEQIEGIHFVTEDSLISHLIPFNHYLEKTIQVFNSSSLPFSVVAETENQHTLSDTFIHPDFTLEESGTKKSIKLEQFVNEWLIKDTSKHLVLLGDYGMGKSSFLKYYASQLSEKILKGDDDIRYPVFIPLTNSSPRHGGIDHLISSFIAKNLSISSDSFYELVYRGKILFLFDGFDEMGFVGTHNQRIKQLNAIWKLVINKNKIIISGRPSYFPDKEQMLHAFNIKNEEGVQVPEEQPFFQRLYLTPFGVPEIKESIKAYYGPEGIDMYFKFIQSNNSLLELCKRPSMMHIVREMLPELMQNLGSKNLKPSDLMRKYIDHWISRQLSKSIVSAFENESKKREFILNFFQLLAGDFYTQGIERMEYEDIIDLLYTSIDDLELDNPDDIEGFESEILTGCLIEKELDGYKFVHKSFKEYFVAQRIVDLLNDRRTGHPLIRHTTWSIEVIDFLYEMIEFDSSKQLNKIPSILRHVYKSQSALRRKIKFFSLRAKMSHLSTKTGFDFLGSFVKPLMETHILLTEALVQALFNRRSSPSKSEERIKTQIEQLRRFDLVAKSYYVSFLKKELSPKDFPHIVHYLEAKYEYVIVAEEIKS